MSADGLPATKEQPSALDGYERAKPGEPIFTLQGGDPIAVEMVKLYISKRRQRALDMDEGREAEAELVRCSEAERTLWAMQNYLAGRAQVDAQEQSERSDEPEAVDLFDCRVRAANKLNEMRGELNEIGIELKRRGFTVQSDAPLYSALDLLEDMKDLIEPRRLFRKD